MENGIKKFMGDLPPVFKGVIALVVTAGVAFAGWKIYKYAKKKSEEANSRKENRDSSSELDTLNKNTNAKQTLSSSEADALATNFFVALDGCGTDGDAVIRNVSKVMNKADWLAVKTAYGTRKINCPVGGDFDGGLEGALTKKVSTFWNPTVVTTLRNKFAAIGIKTGF